VNPRQAKSLQGSMSIACLVGTNKDPIPQPQDCGNGGGRPDTERFASSNSTLAGDHAADSIPAPMPSAASAVFAIRKHAQPREVGPKRNEATAPRPLLAQWFDDPPGYSKPWHCVRSFKPISTSLTQWRKVFSPAARHKVNGGPGFGPGPPPLNRCGFAELAQTASICCEQVRGYPPPR